MTKGNLMKKTILIALIVFSLFFVFLGFYKLFPKKSFQTQKQRTQKLSPKKIVVFQRVVLSAQNQKTFDKITIEKGATALDLLRKKADVKTQGKGKNAFVLEINNLKAVADKKQYWAFYINGKLSNIGAGAYKLKQNDRIKWEIKTY